MMDRRQLAIIFIWLYCVWNIKIDYRNKIEISNILKQTVFREKVYFETIFLQQENQISKGILE